MIIICMIMKLINMVIIPTLDYPVNKCIIPITSDVEEILTADQFEITTQPLNKEDISFD